MIKVTINNICAKLVECEPLTSGMIGKTLDVELSADWAGLSKTAVFSNGDKTIDVLESEWNGNTINIPWEVLETPNRAVSFGIYGYTKSGDDIILAIPTLYTSLGRVYLGTNPSGDESTEPSLPVYAQLDLRVTDLEEHGGGGIPEAPIDGKQYARQDGEWAEVVGGGESYDDTELRERIATIEGNESTWNGKQNAIADLDNIRSGAALGATALQNADIYIPNGLDKTGATDMSTVIQTAINGGTVYLPVGTYRIDNTLSIIGKTFVCDGEIVANGCDAIKVTGEYSNVKIKKITATGHTCVIVGGDRWTSDNVVDVEFAAGAIGFAVGSDTKNTQYSTIKFERITATQYGIYCWCGGGKYNNETLIYGGAIGGAATKGLYCSGAHEVRVMFASIEGVVEEGTGVEFENSSYNQILGLRTGEGYGRYAFSFKGSSSFNFINTHTLNLQDLDISTLSASSVGNVIRGKICSKSIEWEYIANEVYIDGYVGVSFVPLANVETYIATNSISPTTIDDVSYRVVSYANLNKVIKVVNLVYGDSVVTNFMLGREYYDEHSAYFGNSITFKAWAGNKPKFYDSDANLIADFSGGVDSDCKIVIRCIGSTYQNSAYEAQWEVLTIGTNNNVAQLPENVSAFNNDSGYLTLSTLPIYDGGVE